MLYEKKMLILSGDGKGVVLIEKSAHGVRFSLSTFDMPTCGVLKAGVITPSAVFVRDLPERDNPASVFMLDISDISSLHFAVFDTKLRLYGTNVKRMWESNIMDLLCKSDRREPVQDDRATLAALPPISAPPEVLPMPDGSGILQTRLGLYGDEALAESDFYTPLDIASRMPDVDAFLDTPRVLDGLAPLVEPKQETTAAIDAAPEPQPEQEQVQVTQDSVVEPDGDIMPLIDRSRSEEEEMTEERSVMQDEQTSEQPQTIGRDMPWQMEARLLKSKSQRKVIRECAAARRIENATEIKPLRDTSFFERARADIDKLFGAGEKDEQLAALLPDLVWVKVVADGHNISVGRHGNELLCYAVAGTYRKSSPLGDEAQWLPANRSLPTGKGYWLIFQNLATGEIVNNN